MNKFLATLALTFLLSTSVFAQRINVVQTDSAIQTNVSASSTLTGFPVRSAVNGDTSGVGWGSGQEKNGGWNSDTEATSTYSLPFARAYLFDEIVIVGASNSMASSPREAYEGETGTYTNHNFTLQASEDCVSYTTVAAVTNNNLVINHMGFLSPVYARCLQLVFDNSGAAGGMARIVEVKAMARQ